MSEATTGRDVDFFDPWSPDTTDANGVRRGAHGRPYVKVPCPLSLEPVEMTRCVNGRIPSRNRPAPATVQCPKCRGEGMREQMFSRCTSFVGVLEDRHRLEAWKLRTTLAGLAQSPILQEQLLAGDLDDRDHLDALAAQAFERGGGHDRAQKGTDLHKLSEYVDRDMWLPAELASDRTGGEPRPVTLQDRADMAAWHRCITRHGIKMLDLERFVVQDQYRIAGTYDRRVIRPAGIGCSVPRCSAPMILDLKTGRSVDLGQGKIAQQLGVYANSADYDPATGLRTSQDVCTHVGLVVHLPQGTGEATLHTVDLVAGWQAVEISDAVREHRRLGQRGVFMAPVPAESLLDLTRSP